MNPPNPSIRIGILGPEESVTADPRGCNLWATGYSAVLTAAGATPVLVRDSSPRRSWAEALEGVHGLVWTGRLGACGQASTEEERLCAWCRKTTLPVLAVDQGMHLLNSAFGGTLHTDLARERPEALQHRHPPEPGLRHAISVLPGTHLSDIYGEGELVVNSEHRMGVARIARGFRVSGQALDGIVEAIEADGDKWFAMGVQWRPASASASGLDIQLFRGLMLACEHRMLTLEKTPRPACVSAA
jgi:gamma-glutamyl-gamma-aminobutyrate hydrolase PuuD